MLKVTRAMLKEENISGDKDNFYGFIKRPGTCTESSTFAGVCEEDCIAIKNSIGVQSFIDIVKDMSRFDYTCDSSANVCGENDDFNYFKNFNECLDVFQNKPWTLVSKEISELIIQKQSCGNEIEYDNNGDFLDIGRFLDGEPECFGRNINGIPNRKFINIVLTMNTAAYISSEGIINIQKNLLTLSQWLEENNISSMVKVQSLNECAIVDLVIKRYDEALNPCDVAICSNTDFLRRIIFKLREASPTIDSGYGASRAYQEYVDSLSETEITDRTDGIPTLIVHRNGADDIYSINEQFKKFKTQITECVENSEFFPELTQIK